MARRPWSVSRSVSTRLVRADTYPVGSDIWTNDEGEVWVLAEVISQENTILTARRRSTGEVLEIDLGFGEAHPHNLKVVSDMTALHHIHEAGILFNLRERSKLEGQRPYTFMGTILIAVNPLRIVPDPEMSEYVNRPLNPETPHPYAIAELAYHQMRLGAGRKAANQSIVVSGESGAGKTETSKIILRFLTHRSVGGVADLERRVVESSPILESFGNAKTLRNDNSSRFGKFLKLQFTEGKYRLAGAFVETYLLEKSRVLTQGTGERNFHILYQLVAGASGVGADLKLGDVNSYKILSRSQCTTLDDVDDAEEFSGVKTAFDTIGMVEESQTQVWKMLASVLHMSNLEFDKVDHEQGEIASICDRETLSVLASLLAVEESALEAMLTQTVTVAHGETYIKQLSPHNANLTRDAIVKSLYEALFLWVVSVINTSLGKGEDSLPFIGVLDIFGFENFDTKNELEQLLINFTNESLQGTFNKQVFNNELKLYEDEGIDVVVSQCPDNSDCLKMLSAKPEGIIPSLDNVCAEPNPSDARYLDGLHKTYAQHQHFPQTKPKDMRELFWVKHYAGKVKYIVHGWVERNMDRIPESFSKTLATSTHKVVRDSTIKYGKVPDGAAGEEKPPRARKALLKPTVAKAFLGSQQDLSATLLSTTCNFVRCIKPNAPMECGVFDTRYVVGQLQCLGILQTCEVLKVGMPTRVTYSELKEVLGDNTTEADKLFAGQPETALVAAILWAFEIPSEVFRLGKTRVFFRAGQISTLQKILNETGPEKGPWIFGRLKEALANRNKAKAAAEQAQGAVKSAEEILKKVGEETAKVIGSKEEDIDLDGARSPPAIPKQVLSSDNQHRLQSAAKKARKTARESAQQVTELIQAAKEDAVGTYAVGAFERITTASEEAIKTIGISSSTADKLDAFTRTAIGGDVAAGIRTLEDTLKRLRDDFQEAKKRATAAEDAAAKCQVEKTQDLMRQTAQMVSAVESRAEAHTTAAKRVAQASERQAEALREANGLVPRVDAAVEQALGAVSSFKTLVENVSAEEVAAKEASDAKAEAEAEVRRKAAAEKAMLDEQKAAKPTLEDRNETGDDVDDLRSPAPEHDMRGRLMARRTSSVQMFLRTVATPNTSVSPQPEGEKSDVENLNNPAVRELTSGTSDKHGRLAFPTKVDKTVERESMEGYLMEHDELTDRWVRGYFRLDDGLLAYFKNKSLIGTNSRKAMKLTALSMTSYTSTDMCFCVTTGEVAWFLMAEDQPSMDKWMAAINAEVHDLFIKMYNVPEDNYWSQGVKTRSFYRMLAGSPGHQWILTYPEESAPRTGYGLFPGDIIEVVQEITNDGKVFVRLADDRGWTYIRNPVDNVLLFQEAPGEITEDTKEYWFPPNVTEPSPILHGPGPESSLESDPSDETLLAGQYFEAAERFTPSEGSLAFIRLADGRGWVAVKKE